MTTTVLIAALAAALVSPSDGASELPSPLSVAHLGAQIESLDAGLLLDEPGDGRTWARGPSWKASFGEEGLVYIPFFGSDAPQNYPVTFDLQSVTIAGEPLALESRARVRDAQTVALQRGAVDEVYHLTKDTVEQTFVFSELPARGELALEIALTTELEISPTSDGGFDFLNGLGKVHYGRAVAIDAKGRSLELAQWIEEGRLRMVMPADFVAAAELPLVVDPILSTINLGTGGRRAVDIDVAYDGPNGLYQIVRAEVQSALDYDVVGTYYDVAQGILVDSVSIDTTSASWQMPRNAANYADERFLCVARVGTSVGSRRIWGRLRNAATGSSGLQFQISGVGAESVDVGGKGNDISSIYDFMVVWQEADSFNNDFDIVAQAVASDSTLTGGRIVIDGDSTDMDRAPTISKSSGRPDETNADSEYMIVWEREVAADDRNLRAQVIEYTGTMTGHSQFNAYTFGDSRDPDVSTASQAFSYDGERYWVIAFERLIGARHSIFTVVAQDGDADNARNVNVMQNLDVDLDHRDPVVGLDHQNFLIGYQSTATNGDRAVHLTSVNVVHDDGELRTGVALRRDPLAVSDGAPATVAIASHFDGGSPLFTSQPGDALIAWTRTDAPTSNANAAGAIVSAASAYVGGSQYCAAAINSTGTSAWISVEATFWGAGFAPTLRCDDLPANSFGYFLVSNEAGFVVNPGGSQGSLCLQGSVGRFSRPGEVLNSGSNGSFSLGFDSDDLPSPMGSVAVQSGETWHFQCWFRDLGPSSNFSNGVSMTFD